MRTAKSSLVRRAIRLPFLAMLALLCGCDMVVMNPTGDIAVQQRDLILFSTGVMLLIIVPVMVLTVLFAWRYRRGNKNKIYDPNFDHSTTLELVIWACPLLIIVALSAVTWTSTHLLDPFRPLGRLSPGVPVPAGVKPLEVQVVALDWKWLFIYPEQKIATVNELALPVNVPIRFTITSTDQFSTFYAPTMAGMIYAMPGMQSVMNAVLNKPGESWGYSGNYTGAGHTDMRFKLRGMAPADFNRWVAEVKASKQGTLARSTFIALEKPSVKVPVQHFGSVVPALFDRVVNRCVEDGKPCMVDVVRQDMARAASHPETGHPGSAMPPGRDAAPLNGDVPVPALQKGPSEKGAGPNITKPAKPGTPGQLKPGDQRNRDMSAAAPSHTPGAIRAARV